MENVLYLNLLKSYWQEGKVACYLGMGTGKVDCGIGKVACDTTVVTEYWKISWNNDSGTVGEIACDTTIVAQAKLLAIPR